MLLPTISHFLDLRGDADIAAVCGRRGRAGDDTTQGAGRSWTTIDPTTVPNFGNAAGLPPISPGLGGVVGGNTGQFVAVGVINEMTGVIIRPALPIPPNQGGLTEVEYDRPAWAVLIV